MIKGFIALITSGILFNPAVFTGIVIGCIICSLDQPPLRDILTSELFYGIILLIATFFGCILKRVYYTGGRRLNLPATLGAVLWQFIVLLTTILIVSLLVSTFKMSGKSAGEIGKTVTYTKKANINRYLGE